MERITRSLHWVVRKWEEVYDLDTYKQNHKQTNIKEEMVKVDFFQIKTNFLITLNEPYI